MYCWTCLENAAWSTATAAYCLCRARTWPCLLLKPHACAASCCRHYGELALLQLHAALERAQLLRSRLGDEAADALLRREQLALPLADAMLWRDRTTAALDASQRRAEANEVVCDS